MNLDNKSSKSAVSIPFHSNRIMLYTELILVYYQYPAAEHNPIYHNITWRRYLLDYLLIRYLVQCETLPQI